MLGFYPLGGAPLGSSQTEHNSSFVQWLNRAKAIITNDYKTVTADNNYGANMPVTANKIVTSDKFYFEIDVTVNSAYPGAIAGVGDGAWQPDGRPGQANNRGVTLHGNTTIYRNGTANTYRSGGWEGSIKTWNLGFAVDPINHLIWFRIDGAWENNRNPAIGQGGYATFMTGGYAAVAGPTTLDTSFLLKADTASFTNAAPTGFSSYAEADASSGPVALVGTLVRTLAALTTTSASTLALKGLVGKTLGLLTSTSNSKLDLKGSVSRTLQALTSTASGVLASAGTGTLNKTLQLLTSASNARLTLKAFVGKTLQTLTSTSATKLSIKASASKTLAALTSVSSSRLALKAALSKTLQALTTTANAKLNLKASVGKTLQALTSSGFGIQTILGSGFVNKTLQVLTSTSSSRLSLKGAANRTLQALTSASASRLSIKGLTSEFLQQLTTTSSSNLKLKASLTKTLQSLTSTSNSNLLLKSIVNVGLSPLTLFAIGTAFVRTIQAAMVRTVSAEPENRLQSADVESRTVSADYSNRIVK